MKLCGYLIVTALAVLCFFAQQSTSFELSLCLSEAVDGGCRDGKSSIQKKDSSNNNSEARLIVKQGFENYNNSLTAAKNEFANACKQAKTLVATQPQAAVQTMLQGIDRSVAQVFEAGPILFVALGKGSSQTNDSAKPELVQASVPTQLIALEILDHFRTAKSVANQTIGVGGDSAKQAIDVAIQVNEAVFSANEEQISRSSQQADAALASAQPNQPKPAQETESDDSDISAAISELKKAADKAIQSGANSSVVNKLRKDNTDSLVKVGKVAAFVRKYYAMVTKIGDASPKVAQDIYLKDSTKVCKQLQEIVGNVLISLGAAATKSDSETLKKIGNAIQIAEQGNNNLSVGNKYARHLTGFGFVFEGEVRNTTLNAAIQSSMYAKMASVNQILQSTEAVFNAFVR